MSTPDDDIDDLTHFDVGLDDVTVGRLMEVANLSHVPPRQLIAAIVADVLADDFRAHGGETASEDVAEPEPEPPATHH